MTYAMKGTAPSISASIAAGASGALSHLITKSNLALCLKLYSTIDNRNHTIFRKEGGGGGGDQG